LIVVGVLFVLAALQITGSFPWDRQNTRALAAYLWNDTVADMALAMYDHLGVSCVEKNTHTNTYSRYPH
jgi:hypothetical protein